MHPIDPPPQPDPNALAHTVRHLEGLLGAAPDSILDMDTEGMVTDWNPGAERVLG